MLHFTDENQRPGPKPKETAVMCLSSGTKEKGVTNACPIVTVELTNSVNGRSIRSYAMLDGGYEFSIIDQSFATKLGVETTKEEMTVTTLESTVHKE
jgi:hypothetical protein